MQSHRGPPTCQRDSCLETADFVSGYTYCLDHADTGTPHLPYPEQSVETDGIAVDDFQFYFGASCGSSRKTLRQFEEPNVCLSYATKHNTPWDNITSLFIDSGGYSLIRQGDGEYEDSVDDYLAYIEEVEPNWFVTRDVPAADRVLNTLDEGVSEAISRTVAETMNTLVRMKTYDIQAKPIAVLQGKTPEDYVDCYWELARAEAVTNRLAIGSLKEYSPERTCVIINRVASIVPDDIELHGLGVEVPDLEYQAVRDALSSADSSRYIATARWRGNRDEHPPRLRADEPKSGWLETARAYLDMRSDLRSVLTESPTKQSAETQAVLPT